MAKLLILLVIVIMGIPMVRGFTNGFMRSVLVVLAFVLALILLTVVGPLIYKVLRSWSMFYDFMIMIASFILTKSLSAIGESSVLASLNMTAGTVVDSMNLPNALKVMILQETTESSSEVVNVAVYVEEASGYLAELIMEVVVGIVTFLLIYALVAWLFRGNGKWKNVPVVKMLNQLGGLALGFFQGLAVIWILCLILMLFSETETGQLLIYAIEGNTFLSVFYSGPLSLWSLFTRCLNILAGLI